jgi:FMN phosphatase YigB (HAD superfamily)
LGLQPEECVYIDELARHCRGAEIAGMKSIQVGVFVRFKVVEFWGFG